MDFITLILLFISCYWLYVFFQKKLNYFKDLGIPYVPGLPILGNMAATAFRRSHINETVTNIYNYNRNAKYIGAFNFNKPVIFIRDTELIKSITIKNFEYFADHEKFIDDNIDPLFGTNLFAMSGDKWREARNLLTPAFTASKMKGMFELMIECVENFIKHVAEEAKNPNNMIATKDIFAKYTVDVIATCAFGINIDSMKNPNNDFYVLGRAATNFEGFLSFKLLFYTAFPRLMKFLKIPITNPRVARFFTDLVRATVKMRDEKGISRPDMIQLMMDARDKTSDGLKLDVMEMTAHALVFFFGGFDTTSTQMCIMAHELALNPNIQKKLQAEIDNVLEECQGKPTYEAINAMPYFDAVFHESMRRHSVSTFTNRVCTKPFELSPALPGYKSFTVQPGMILWIPIAAIHHDEKYHKDPEVFDPQRFLNKKMTFNQTENLSFGIGPRSCIGNRFAILETKILFFYLLAKFNLKANVKTCNPFTYSKGSLIIMPEGGYWLTIEPRH